MRWLEGSKDPTEKRIREGLDLARDRMDDLASRRTWGHLSEPELFPSTRRWPWLVAALGLVGSAAVALVLLVPPRARPATPPVAVTPAPARSTAPQAPAVQPFADALEVVGPATVRTGVHQQKRLRLRGGTRVHLDSESIFAVDAGQRPAVQAGRARLEVPRQAKGEHFTVAVGPYVIVVVGTVFDVGMDQGMANVKVSEGVVEVWRDGEMWRLAAGATWQGPTTNPTTNLARASGRTSHRSSRRGEPRRLAAAAPTTDVSVSAPAPAPAPPEQPMRASDRFRVAKAALADGEVERGMAILESLAEGTGPVAENASYEVGRALRDRLVSPREAIDAWNRYRTRFPRGLLRAEADISILETLLSVGDRAGALTEAEGFLRRYPRSERRAEVLRLVERLRPALEVRAAGGP